MTNNIAEYSAVIIGLEIATALGAKRVRVFADSQLVVRQMTGVYKVKDTKMQALKATVDSLVPFLNRSLSSTYRARGTRSQTGSRIAPREWPSFVSLH